MVWKVVKSAQPPVRYRPNSDRRPDIVFQKLQTTDRGTRHTGPYGAAHQRQMHTSPCLTRQMPSRGTHAVASCALESALSMTSCASAISTPYACAVQT